MPQTRQGSVQPVSLLLSGAYAKLTGGVQLGLLIPLYQVVIWSAVATLPAMPPTRGTATATACMKTTAEQREEKVPGRQAVHAFAVAEQL